MADLFDTAPSTGEPRDSGPRPLADRLRPKRLSDVIGQSHLLGPEGSLRVMLDAGSLPSLIFWGPPGVGKTTIARLLAAETDLHFVQISAIFTGVPDLRKVFEAARHRHANGQGTLLFVDEIHRFNKAQQDGFLPHMEDGTILLVGATTENPSFELNAALLSRAQVLVLERLSDEELSLLLERAETELDRTLPLTPEARHSLLSMADGDGRALLNLVEQVAAWKTPADLDAGALAHRLQRRAAQYDKSGEAHYNLISALHKSVRGSDPDAALYWLARMLEGGEDPRFLARGSPAWRWRISVSPIRQAQRHCLDAWATYERLGSSRGGTGAGAGGALPRARAEIERDLRGLQGSAGEREIDRLAAAAQAHPERADQAMMKEQGYGAGYAYDHDAEDGFSGQNYFPNA
jgi:putative ATPase